MPILSTREEAYETHYKRNPEYNEHSAAYWTDMDRNKPVEPTVVKTQHYYDIGGIEAIDVIKAKLSQSQYEGYLLGNIIKYSLRLNYKGDKQKDAHKLAEYSEWLDESLGGTK